MILKKQSAAVRDGDTILGVIKATDTMHNGRTQGLVAPSAKGQAALQKSLLRLSSLTPGDIEYVFQRMFVYVAEHLLVLLRLMERVRFSVIKFFSLFISHSFRHISR